MVRKGAFKRFIRKEADIAKKSLKRGAKKGACLTKKGALKAERSALRKNISFSRRKLVQVNKKLKKKC